MSFCGCDNSEVCDVSTTLDLYIEQGTSCSGESCTKACQRELDELNCLDDNQTPCLVDFQMRGQSRDASTIVTFELAFIDEDRDFSDGELLVYVSGQRKDDLGLQLKDLFRQHGVEFDADRGVLEFSVELSVDNVQNGAVFTIGIRLLDGAGHQSELQEITLEFGT